MKKKQKETFEEFLDECNRRFSQDLKELELLS